MDRSNPQHPQPQPRAGAPDDGFRLTFLGATGTVTGSRYLVEAGGRRVLVDCGLFQGYKQLRLRNWAPFPVDPASIDAVVLTHAHLDHSGYLPRLVQDGFRGPVFCTAGTEALCRLLLPDSGHLLEEEAEFANRHGYSKHHPALPLYTELDAGRALRRLQPIEFDVPFEPVPGLQARFRRAGHILGAASVLLRHGDTRVVFSGDLGRPDDPVMRPPLPPDACDVLVVESTYGNRRHPDVEPEAELGGVLARVAARGGVAVIPAFAVGRAQALLHLIERLKQHGTVPRSLPVYLNSPMARDATALMHRFRDDHRLDDAACRALKTSATIVNSVEESKALNRRRGPMVIVSASGMATGGRVLHHLVAFASDPRNAIVLAGYQAGGTRGAALADGAATLRMFGREVPVRAEVVQLRGTSAHADADELLAWMRAMPARPARTFVTHGEPDAADALRGRIEHELQWDAAVPELGATFDLHALAARSDAEPVD